jgi:hypothetical protein
VIGRDSCQEKAVKREMASILEDNDNRKIAEYWATELSKEVLGGTRGWVITFSSVIPGRTKTLLSS